MEPKGERFDPSSSASSPSTSTSSSHRHRRHPHRSSHADEDSSTADSPHLSAASPAKSPEDALERTPSLEPPDSASSPPSVGRRSSRGGGGGGGGSDKEKRKRSRVTPDQLVHLERFFAMDRSPTAARRKEISELLGMQERQTQIWFQNRRAKAKLLDGKSKTRGDGTPPHTPPELQPAYEADLQSLLHESEPITIIPCYDLTIGTWRRIATQIVGKHDLVTYLCETRRCLVWFIHSAGYGFKMEIPFETVLETEFTNAAPGQGRASFRLSQPPQFFLEDVASAMSADPAHRPPGRTWRRCADWTEHAQATNVLQHDLVGAAAQLAHVLRAFQPFTGSEIRLHSPPAYHPSASASGTHTHMQPSTHHHHTPNHARVDLPRIDVPRAHPHAPTHGFPAHGGGGSGSAGTMDRRASYPGALLASDFRTLDLPPATVSAQSSPAPSNAYAFAGGLGAPYATAGVGGYAGVDEYGALRGYAGAYQQAQQLQQQQQQQSCVGFGMAGASPAQGQYSLPASPSPPLSVGYHQQQVQQDPGAYQPSGMVGTLMPLPPPNLRYAPSAGDDARY